MKISQNNFKLKYFCSVYIDVPLLKNDSFSSLLNYGSLRTVVVKDSAIKCILCKEVSPNSAECIISHLNSEAHRILYIKRLLLENNIILSPDNFICNICNQFCFWKFNESHKQ